MSQILTTEGGDTLVTEASDSLIGERSYPPYEGYNIFDLRVNWAEEPTETLTRSMTTLENVTGRPLVRSHSPTPVPSFEVYFTLEGRSQIQEFRSWLRTFKGRQIPCWIPTWQADMKPTADLSGSSFTIESIGYEDNLYPHNARKHLAIIRHDGEIFPRGVTSASDNGTTETIGISPGVSSLDKDHTLVSFLVLARLLRDEVEIVYNSYELADVRMGFIEVPREAPAP